MPTINNGDVAFMVVTTVLVFLMTPGLAFFYGMLRKKKFINNDDVLIHCYRREWPYVDLRWIFISFWKRHWRIYR